MTDAIIDDYLVSFDDSRFPSELIQNYELLECLSQNEMGETLLVKDRQTGEHCVAKCYGETSLLSRTTESDLLKKLQHKGLPAYIGEYQNEKMLCVVRSYVPGKPLDQMIRERPLTNQQAVDISIQVCEILTYLHGLTPPIIHRDIKPQNIIVDGQGRVTLIDFGTSRLYNETAQEDTFCFGTRHYAAPEQYGFSQTDCRTDIYSLGVLLYWMLTGSVEIEQAQKTISDRRLARIITKCTAFDPKNRYKNAAQVRAALTGHPTRRGIQISACIALIILAAVLYLPKISVGQNRPPIGVTFQEPLIEKAVRLSLGKGDTEILSEQDLQSITGIYIFGDKVAANEQTFQSYAQSFASNDGTVGRGDIDQLGDLVKMKNLRNIHLADQQIQDLTPLSELGYVESVDLRHNPIEDISPLSKISSLASLFLFDTRISDLTALRNCPHLSTLDIGYTQVKSTNALDGLDSLQTLMIRKAPLQSLENIETHPMLEEVYLSQTQLFDLSPLLSLPRLKRVEVDENMRAAADAIADQARFEIIYQ